MAARKRSRLRQLASRLRAASPLRRPSTQEFDPVLSECRRLINGGLFYDIGANVGEIAEAMLPHARHIVAVEADVSTYTTLVERLGGRATCLNTLVGPDDMERTWLHNTNNHTGSTSVAPGDEPQGHDYLERSTMRAVSLDTIMREHGRPDVIKLDCEGFEMSILESAKALLATRPAVVMEFNALCLSNFGRVNPRDAIDRICAIFPRVERIKPGGRDHVVDRYAFLSDHILRNKSVDNLVCTWD